MFFNRYVSFIIRDCINKNVNDMKLSCILVFIIVFCMPLKSISLDTTFISYPKNMRLKINNRHQYHQTFVMKLFMAEAPFEGKYKRDDRGDSKLFLNCEQTLDIIKKLDILTLEMPKIVYLVGWQYNGHDSKYPAFFEANPMIKRSQDDNALESLRWLMNEAQKYHTTVSLHINMFDAYQDSPLWQTYLDNNIIAREKDGSIRWGEWGAPISYAQEWKLGFTQKRIDRLCEILPVQASGTIHIDAFHTWPPIPYQEADGTWKVNLEKKVISPFLDYTIEDEEKAQCDIMRYWDSKGVDVTCEGVHFLRNSPLEGYQPMAYWFGGDSYWKWPAKFYCGGMDNSDWGKLFGTNANVEDIFRKNAEGFVKFTSEFCQKTLIWYFLNQLERVYSLEGGNYQSVQFSKGVRTELKNGVFKLMQDECVLVDQKDVLLPALWREDGALIAYSEYGYKEKCWSLPRTLNKSKTVTLYKVDKSGQLKIGTTTVRNQKITLSLNPGEMVVII